jgi:hypothetical protein
LDDSLGAFDAQLKKEQQTVAQERDARQPTPGGGSSSTESPAADTAPSGDRTDASGSTAPRQRGGDDRKSSQGDKRQRPGDLKSEKSTSKPDDNAGNGASAREIPDGSDDDVVARRLRKAAEEETDPELKDKLWKEYIEYKKNGQTK